MKRRIIFLLLACISLTTATYAQTVKETKKMYADDKKKKDVVNKQVQQKAIKEARKEAKRLTKLGYAVPVGKISMEKQLEQSWRMQYEIDDDYQPKYLIGTSTAVGGSQSAAKLQATNTAKLELVSNMESQLAQMIEQSTSNEEISPEEAVTLNSMISSSKTIVSGKLGEVIPVVEVTRKLSTGNFETQVTVAYDREKAFKVTKDAIRNDLKQKSEALAGKLDEIL